VKEIFFKARDKSAMVGIGRPKDKEAGEMDEVKELRKLLGM
jgi:hypothetical protein